MASFSQSGQDNAARLRALLRLELLCLLVPAAVISAIGLASGFDTLISWLTATGGADSWKPINHALAYVDTHASGSGLYQETYFRAKDQFIYAPQGLALLQLVRDIAPFDIWAAGRANIVSWPSLPIMILIAATMMFRLLPASGRNARNLLLILACASASVFFFYPITKGYELGQIQNWLTALLAASLLLYMSSRMFWAGFLIGLTALIKPHVAAVLLWALLRRNWQFAAGLLCPIIFASLLSVTLYGWAIHFEYLDLLSYLSSRGESYYASHSFESALYRMLHNGNNLVWDGRHLSVTYVPWVHSLASLLSAGTLLLASLPARGSGKDFRFLDYSLILCALVIASPVAYDHHFGIVALVAPGAALIFMGRAGTDGPRWLPLLGGISYALIGGLFVVTDRLADTDFNILQSYRLFGIVPGLCCLCALRAQCRDGEPVPSEEWEPRTNGLLSA